MQIYAYWFTHRDKGSKTIDKIGAVHVFLPKTIANSVAHNYEFWWWLKIWWH